VALEPEAASLYCIEWMKRESKLSLEREEKILVLDAGGKYIYRYKICKVLVCLYL
jgi:hypothetical protein